MSTVVNLVGSGAAPLSFDVTWQQPNDEPMDLTDCQAHMQMRWAAGGPLVLDAATSNYPGGNGWITLGGTAGTISVVIPATTMAAVRPGLYGYDLDVIFADGTPQPQVVTGQVMVSQQVTVDV